MPSLLRAAVVAATLLVPSLAWAQGSFPSRAIRIVSPFAAGSVSDISLRILSESLGPRLSTQIVIENQPTGGGVAAARSVLSAERDGHTLALLSNATAVSAALYKKLPYDPLADFTAVGGISDFSYVILSNGKSKLRTLQDVIEAARAKPGALNFATAASGTSPHLTALLFRKIAGIDFAIVTFRGASDLTVAVMRNDVDVMINAYGAVKGNIDDGSLHPIATTAATRAVALPNVPTVVESGISNFVVTSWNALYAPTGTPKAAVERLGQELRSALAEPRLVQRFAELGVEARPNEPAAIEERMRDEIGRWARVIEEAGVERQ